MDQWKTAKITKQGAIKPDKPKFEGFKTCDNCDTKFQFEWGNLYRYTYKYSEYQDINADEVVVFCPLKGCNRAFRCARKIESEEDEDGDFTRGDWKYCADFPIEQVDKVQRIVNPTFQTVKDLDALYFNPQRIEEITRHSDK